MHPYMERGTIWSPARASASEKWITIDDVTGTQLGVMLPHRFHLQPNPYAKHHLCNRLYAYFPI